MKELIIANWPTILIMALFFIYIIILLVTRKYAQLRETAYKIMLAAEKKFSKGQGRKKLNYVLEKVYNLIPAWMRMFVSKEDFEIELQYWYNTAKDYADDGKFNNSVS